MSVREQIMAIPCPPNKLGFNIALKQAADIAEAREKELLAEKAALIAELSGLNWCNLTDAHRIDAILDKYESKT
jgi:hypothetical protein